MRDPFALALAASYDEADTALAGRRDVEAAWIRAYILNARGDFEGALTLARRALRRPASAEARARLLVTAGSAARQLRRYAAAERFDSKAVGLEASDTAITHARIGLAADAVGRGDPEACATRLALAEAGAPAGDWRVRVRLRWVRCEHALLAGDPERAAQAASEAVERSRAAGAPRHEAKSSLFAGVAQRDLGAEEWIASITHAHTIAARIGAKAIEAVAAAELARQRIG